MRAGAPGRWPPSALCSLTEQMHLHGYVQRKFADATCKHRVHDRDDSVREHERPPSAASTPKPVGPADLIARPLGRRGSYAPWSPPSARSSPRTIAPSSDLTSTNPVQPAASSRFSW